MTVDEFVAKYNGKYIDEDGYYGSQCWDVSARYAREVVGCPSFPTGSGGAEGLYRIFANPIPQYFDRIANNKSDPNQLPKKGDVIVWNKNFSYPWGHTAVCISANSSGVTVLEQNGGNDPNGDGKADGVAYIKTRGWTHVDGWLRPKNGGTTVAIVQNAENWYGRLNKLHQQVRGRDLGRDIFAQLVGKDTLTIMEIFSDSPEADAVQHWQNVGKNAVADRWDQQIYSLQDQLKTARTTIDERNKQVSEMSTQIGVLKEDIASTNLRLDELVKVVSIKDGEIKRLAEENAKLQAQVGDENLTIKQAIRVLYQTVLDAIKQK